MNWVLSPLAWLIVASLLIAFALVEGARLRTHSIGIAGIALGVISLSAMTPLVANALAAYLERPTAVDPICRNNPPPIVVVLTGGMNRRPATSGDFGALNLASRLRMERAVQYWRGHGDASLLIAGGPVHAHLPAAAALMSEYALSLGPRGVAIRLERESTNTLEAAWNIAGMLPHHERISLVTSAMHMPRALAAFRRAGFDVCPLPTDYRAIPTGPPGYLVPRSSALVKTEAALHELVGSAYYRWRDWRRLRGGS